jgi:hypothetical protein
MRGAQVPETALWEKTADENVGAGRVERPSSRL